MSTKTKTQITLAWVGPEGATFSAGNTVGYGSHDLQEDEAAEIMRKVASRHAIDGDRMNADALFAAPNGRAVVEDLLDMMEGRYLVGNADKRLLLARSVVKFLYRPIHLKPEVGRFVAALFYKRMVDSGLDCCTLARQCELMVGASSSQHASAIFDILLGRDGPLRPVRRFVDAQQVTQIIDGKEVIASQSRRHETLDGVSGDPFRSYMLANNLEHVDTWISRHKSIEVLGEIKSGVSRFWCDYQEIRGNPRPIRFLLTSPSLRVASIAAGAAAKVAEDRSHFGNMAARVERHSLGETTEAACAPVKTGDRDAVAILKTLTRLAKQAEEIADHRVPMVQRPVDDGVEWNRRLEEGGARRKGMTAASARGAQRSAVQSTTRP